MSELSMEQKKEALAYLNEIAPDTFDEGEFGSWRFTSISRSEEEWRIGFRNRSAADGDVLTFRLAGEAMEGGAPRQAWSDALQRAVFDWEAAMVGEE